MNIKCIKTIIGEDLIGEISTTLSGDLKINNPCAIIMVPMQNNQFTIGLAPYMPFVQTKEFTYDSKNILFVCDPTVDLKNEYNRIMGTGIVIPKTELSLIK
jgi:hypothetical protein